MGDFLRAEVAAGRRYLPAGDRVLRAFQQPFADVRVLIVGQDPYPTPGNPVGLSFSVAPETRRLPASLVNIFREYGEDLGYPRPATGDLSVWTERGVMLLNRVLTAGRAGRRSRSKRSGRSPTVTARWSRFSGAVTRAAWHRSLALRAASSPRIRVRTRPTAGSSVRGPSAGPTSCSKKPVRSPSTGSCRNTHISFLALADWPTGRHRCPARPPPLWAADRH